MNKAQLIAVGFVAGIAVSGATMAIAQVRASVNTNGVLVDYTVQKDGQVVCEDPSVYVEFRGPESYIICE
jgi:hypothetical protein